MLQNISKYSLENICDGVHFNKTGLHHKFFPKNSDSFSKKAFPQNNSGWSFWKFEICTQLLFKIQHDSHLQHDVYLVNDVIHNEFGFYLQIYEIQQKNNYSKSTKKTLKKYQHCSRDFPAANQLFLYEGIIGI